MKITAERLKSRALNPIIMLKFVFLLMLVSRRRQLSFFGQQILDIHINERETIIIEFFSVVAMYNRKEWSDGVSPLNIYYAALHGASVIQTVKKTERGIRVKTRKPL
jgi:hypothetical protein